jgi:hypothetical protein
MAANLRSSRENTIGSLLMPNGRNPADTGTRYAAAVFIKAGAPALTVIAGRGLSSSLPGPYPGHLRFGCGARMAGTGPAMTVGNDEVCDVVAA